jgi:hypothetical protein
MPNHRPPTRNANPNQGCPGCRCDNRGAILIGLIITIVVLSALGAAMLAQTNTQEYLLAGGRLSDQAYYLAESGYRYAAAKFKSNADIEALITDGPYDMGGGERFALDFFTYIFEITGGVGTDTLEVTVPFGRRPELVDTSGSLSVEGGSLQLYDAIDMTDPNPKIIRFVKSSGTWTGWDGQWAKPVIQSVAYSGGSGGDLDVFGALSVFPEKNGRFSVDGNVYRYQRKDEASNELVGITLDGGGSWVAPAAGSNVTLQPFIELHSTGMAGTGRVSATRRLVFAIPLLGEDDSEFHDRFADRSHWEATSTLGDHAVKEIGGDSALKVTRADTPSGSIRESLIAFDADTTSIDFKRTSSTNGGFLNYDTQVKIGFEGAPTPDHGFDPLPIPKYFAAGLAARLDNNSRFLGVSFLRGSNDTDPRPDNIFNEIVPLDQKPLIVLWHQTNDAADRTWLAYKELTPAVFFSDDMESGESQWTKEGTWGLVTTQHNSPTHSWHDSPGGDYANDQNMSVTTLPANLSWERDVELVFHHRYDLESEYDYGYVEISSDGFATFQQLAAFTNSHYWLLLVRVEVPQDAWVQVRLPIPSSYLTDNVQVRFRMVTDFSVVRDGWYIDDVALESTYFPLNEATLVLRLREAASVIFADGNAAPIQPGDVVTQASTGAYGVVLGEPILSSGTWGTDAAGTLLLNRISPSYNFAAGDLRVNGVVLAQAPAGGFRPKDNYIRVYYGDSAGYGTANATPFDMERHGNPRCTVGCDALTWPPGEVGDTLPENDYFTIVQWDVVNSAVASIGVVDSATEPNVILRSSESTLLSPVSAFFAQPELGLHAYGKGVENVYFDDFGVRTDSPSISAFSPAVQY